MKWEAKIKKVNNGFVMTFNNGEGIQEEVYKEKDPNDETNRDHVIDMLYDILEVFSEWGSKHDKRRIKIGYTKGDEYSLKDAQSGVDFEVYE